MNHLSKNIAILSLALFAVTMASAQKKKKTTVVKPAKPAVVQPEKVEAADTSSPKMVTITSAFKPTLKSAAKVNFIAATPVIDSSKIPVVYNIPSQNLFFSYKAVSIKPLALNVDSNVTWQNDQYIKLGAGNFSSYLGEAGFSFGDGKNSITTLKGSFITSTGHLFAQQANRLDIDAMTIFKTGESHEWNAHAFYKESTQYFYGYQPSSLAFFKEDLLQRFNTVGIELGVQNKLENPYGVKYHPQVSFVRFSNNSRVSENDLVVSLPFSKVFNKFYAFNLGLTADMSSTATDTIVSTYTQKNNIYYVDPAFLLTTPNVKLHLGIRPSWDNQAFSLLPQLTAEARITDASFSLEAGWVGYYNKNTARTIAAINPWAITSPPFFSPSLNTRVNEQYVGIKGNSGSHFTYNARLSLLTLKNQLLLDNGALDGRRFYTSYEPNMKAIRLHAEAGYTVGEKLSFLASTTYTQYSDLSINSKAYGLLPFEGTGTVKWKALKDLQIKADVFLWDGAYYTDKSAPGVPRKADPAADLSLGAEFTVVPRLNLWFQMNNMLNTAYERWHQYPVLGFTVLGGVVYSFR